MEVDEMYEGKNGAGNVKTVFLFSLAFAFMLLSVSQVAAVTCGQGDTVGIIGYWKGENNVNDTLGLHNGQILDGMTYAAGRNGVGQAFSTNGNGYAEIQNAINSPLQERTISAWIKWNYASSTPVGDNPIVTISPSSGWGSYGVSFMNRQGILHLNSRNAGSWIGELNIPITWNAGEWHHVAVTWNSSGTILYYDGSPIGSDSRNRAVSGYEPNIYIGRNGDNSRQNAVIDEVAVFNRALSQPEVSALYAKSAAGQDYCAAAAPTCISSNIALSKTYTKSPLPHSQNPDDGDAQLTNGIPVQQTYYGICNDVGWLWTNNTVVVDLAQLSSIDKVRIYSGGGGEGGIRVPDRINISASINNVNWNFITTKTGILDVDGWIDISFTSTSARYVKIEITQSTIVSAAWTTLGEIEVYNSCAAAAPTSGCSATGGTVTQVGDYTIHTFTSSGTFSATGNCNAEVLVVAGGSGGGAQGGGGGAGGVLNGTFVLSASNYLVIVGAGGAGAPDRSASPANGQNSLFGSLITAVGGGGGGSSDTAALTGGSGGGGAVSSASRPGAAGTAGQGNTGGNNYASVNYGGGGGGGAGAAGQSGTSSQGGNGGIGIASSISGTSTYYAGGGGGGIYQTSPAGVGGLGGGGNGTIGAVNAQNAIANTGGGGGGSGNCDLGARSGGNGGSGIVIIRYLAAAAPVVPTCTNGTTNIALTGTASASSLYCNGCNPAHQIDHLNDGLYGNSHSWLGVSPSNTNWAMITLPATKKIGKVVFSRARVGEGSCCADRDPGTSLRLLYSTDGSTFNEVPNKVIKECNSDLSDCSQSFDGDLNIGQAVRITFDPVDAKYVKLDQMPDGVCIDELEIYEAICTGAPPEPICTAGQTQSCYTGPAGTEDMGACQAGTQTCSQDGMSWGECTGEVTPQTEQCNNIDDDCNGVVDNVAVGDSLECTKTAGVCQGAKQTCSDGYWNDCTTADYQAHSSYYRVAENTGDTCWDGEDNDCNDMADSAEPKCQPGGAPLPLCTVKDMEDLNNDGTIDSFDALLMLRTIILFDNNIVGTKECQAVILSA